MSCSGGIGWTGATTCVSGYTCTVSNPYYSQCLPGAATTTAVPTTVAPTTVNPTTSVPATTTPSSTATSSAPAATGSQIRTDQDPAYHLYLQNIGGTPTLGPEASSGYFTIGSTIALNNADGSQLFFNVNANATTAWKPVTFDKTATTTTWSLSGDTIIYGNQQNFIVCPISGSTNYNLYLSTSNDMPTGCTNYITIHLPCLC
ncbi:carbohydrate-binding module family 1 protein [Sphaerobolus stellatus SS14]|nr:carbohydrate-binding module family 1 protein [Sphaerobolus stellatus SS14]